MFRPKWLKAEHAGGGPGAVQRRRLDPPRNLLVGCLALLARHALVLLRHRTTIVLFAIGLALGAASQTLDSVVEPSRWEFVAEECLKLSALPFVLAGYLAALKDSAAPACAWQQPAERREQRAEGPAGEHVGRVVRAE